mmetsp:Transcript_154140/g.272128  ORF Transcript_154140/g.272128 Transcript_154140/m.272128 type:complete len:284 (+) Transcript_154140:75-926(+)
MPAKAPQKARDVSVRVVYGFSAEFLCTIDVEPDMDVADLKWEVAQSSGIPHAEQRLLLRGRVLRNAEVLLGVFSETSESLPAEVTLVRLDPRFAKMIRDIETGQLHLKDIDDELRSDRDIVLAALRRDGHSLQFVSDALRSDPDVVLAAVKISGRSLEYASTSLQADKELVMLAVSQDGLAIRYADRQLRSDLDVVLAAVKQNGFALEMVPSDMQARHDVASLALQQEGEAFQFLSDSLKNERDLVLMAVRSSADALRWVPSSFRHDDEVVKAAWSGIRIHSC